MSTNKPQVSLTSVSTGEGPSMITTINFSGGLLKDTRLERQDGSRGHSLVVHGQHEVEEFFTGIVCAAARFETWKKRVAGETADSVAGVESEPVKEAIPEPTNEVAAEAVQESLAESEDASGSSEEAGSESAEESPSTNQDASDGESAEGVDK